MRPCRLLRSVPFALLLLTGMTFSADAPETPIGPKWWPSEWGANDQRGAANRLTPQKVQQAARLIQKGKVYSLGRPYEYGMPIMGKRHFSLTIPGSPTGGPDGQNRLVYHDELFSGEIGQIGTQLDGLGHVGVRMAGDFLIRAPSARTVRRSPPMVGAGARGGGVRGSGAHGRRPKCPALYTILCTAIEKVSMAGDDYFYNGFRRSEFGKPYGLEKLGIENVGVFFTRGVLADLPTYKGVPRLKIGEVITAENLEGALKKEGVEVGVGDVVLIRTGHGQLWMKDNATFNQGEPGIGMGAGRWLCDKRIVLVGSDSWATEVVPPENKNRPFEVHQLLLVRNGIYNLENLDLEELARNKVYEFAFIFAPLRLKGATGSPGNPIAVH